MSLAETIDGAHKTAGCVRANDTMQKSIYRLCDHTNADKRESLRKTDAFVRAWACAQPTTVNGAVLSSRLVGETSGVLSRAHSIIHGLRFGRAYVTRRSLAILSQEESGAFARAN